jgi:hypothetical protein
MSGVTVPPKIASISLAGMPRYRNAFLDASMAR